MDLFHGYLLYLAIFLAFLYLFTKPKSRPDADGTTKLPRGTLGWPIMGETLEFKLFGKRGHPEGFTNKRISTYSKDVFSTSLFGENMAVFCGAEGNKFLFSGENKYVKTWWPISVKKVVSYPDPPTTEKPPSVKRRTFLLDFIKPEALRNYVHVMDSMSKQHLAAEWSPYRQVNAFEACKKYSFDLATRIFLNIQDPNQVKKLMETFTLINEGLMSVPVNLPGTAYNRAIKAGQKIRADLMDIVLRRKKEISMEIGSKTTTRVDDFLSRMILFEDDAENGGGGMKDTEIVNSIVGLLIASHDTTSTSITFLLNYLAEYPHVYDQVLKEQMEIKREKQGVLTWEDVQKMKYSWMVVCESMRLTPPAHGAFREAAADFTYAGYTIPKGWKTYWTVHSTHKNPKYFADPERFDPSRFSGKGPAPYTFVPFGGGPRMCPGKEFARLEILVFMHHVVTNFRLKKAIPDEKVIYNPNPIPLRGLPLHIKSHVF